MVEFIEVELPSLPLINNDPVTLARFPLPNWWEFRTIIDGAQAAIDLDPPTADDVADAIDIPDIPTVEDIAAEVDETLTFPDVPEPPSLDNIANRIAEDVGNPITSRLSTVQDDLQQSIDSVVGDIEEDLDEGVNNLSQAIQNVQDGLNSLDSGLSNVVDDVDTILSSLPEDFGQAVENAIQSVWPDVDDVSFFDSPERWLGRLLERGAETVVDDESQQRLSDKAERYR